jgi:cytochrome c oxidase subunit 1
LIIPGFGIASQIIVTFTKKQIFGKIGMLYAMLSIAFLGYLVWAHHMARVNRTFVKLVCSEFNS